MGRDRDIWKYKDFKINRIDMGHIDIQRWGQETRVITSGT